MVSTTARSVRGSLRTWAGTLSILCAVGLAATQLPGRVSLWPRSNLPMQAFDDHNAGGRSTARLDTSEGALHLEIRLDSGAAFPVAGAILHLGRRGKGLDLSGTGRLHLEIGPSRLSQVQICLVEEIPGFTQEDRWQTARYDCQDASLIPGQSAYDLPLDRFLTPSWWYPVAGVRPAELGPETRQRIVKLVLQSGDGTPLRDPRDLRLERIEVRTLRWARSILVLLVGTGLGLFLLLGGRGRARPAPAGGAPIQFEPVEAVSYADRERQSVVQHIGSAYPDAELSLESVSRATGVPQDRVTSHVKAASGLLFKAYLNRVRVESARKLLLETDLPVSEIAVRVGYGNISHFNRIFREVCGTTPSALREEGAGLSQSPSEPSRSS